MVVDAEAQQKDVRLGVRERADARVALLAGSIPEGELDLLATDSDLRFVILEHSRHVFFGELPFGIGNKHACFTNGTIADDYTCLL